MSPRNESRFPFLLSPGEAPVWSDPSPGGVLHRLLAFLIAVADAHLAHERVIDDQIAAAFRTCLREPSPTSAAQLLWTLLTSRKVRASDLLGIAPLESPRAAGLTSELRDLLRAVRLDQDTATSEAARERLEDGVSSADLLVEFLATHFEGEILVSEDPSGPVSLPSAARPGPSPARGPAVYLVRRDASRLPLHPFVTAAADGSLRMLWDFGSAGRWRRAPAQGFVVEETLEPIAEHAEFFVEYLLKMGAYCEVRDWLRNATAEERTTLERRNILYAGFCHYGTMYLRQREFGQAAIELEKAVKLRPDLVLAHLYLAQAHVSAKQVDRAIEILKRHAVMFSRSDRLFELLGDCHRQKKDTATALRMYEKSASLNPFNAAVSKKRDTLREEAKKDRDEKAQRAVAESGGATAPQPSVRLEDYLVDMTLEAELGLYHGTVGREDEMRQLIEVLACRDKRNALLLGEPGVGKTALVEDFVLQLIQRKLPARLSGKRIYLMTVATLLAGAKFRGQFEERVLDLVKILKTQDCILFIDNFHNIVNAGLTRGGTLDTSNILKPFLVKGEIQVIGATTHDEYRQNVEKDVSLVRCFQTLSIEEPSVASAADMVCHVRGRYEQHHRIVLPESVIRATLPAIAAAVRERALPDKAIDVYDRACAVASMRRADLRASTTDGSLPSGESDPIELTRDDVLAVLSEISRIPVTRLTEDDRSKFARMESHLSARVIGQAEAVSRVSRVLRAARMRLTLDERRPKGVFLFVGPTGVGKTELARALAELLFGSDDRLIRIDMSEYMERINQSRLIGTAPGYVGYNDQNQLTDEVRKNPYSLVLLDEIEKADHNMMHLFLQVFDAGRLTDGKGRTVHFDSTTLVMTSNVGTHLFSRATVGFDEGRGVRRPGVSQTDVMREVRRHFPPEFLNRIDEIICFAPLSEQDVRQIARQKVKKFVSHLERQGKRLELTDAAEELLAREGYSYEEGARNLERTIRRLMLEPLAARALDESWDRASVIRVASDGTALTFDLGEREAEVVDEAEPLEGEAPIDAGR